MLIPDLFFPELFSDLGRLFTIAMVQGNKKAAQMIGETLIALLQDNLPRKEN